MNNFGGEAGINLPAFGVNLCMCVEENKHLQLTTNWPRTIGLNCFDLGNFQVIIRYYIKEGLWLLCRLDCDVELLY